MTQLFNSFFYPSIILYSKYTYQNCDQIICYKSRDNGGIDLDIQFSNNSEIKNVSLSTNNSAGQAHNEDSTKLLDNIKAWCYYKVNPKKN